MARNTKVDIQTCRDQILVNQMYIQQLANIHPQTDITQQMGKNYLKEIHQYARTLNELLDGADRS